TLRAAQVTEEQAEQDKHSLRATQTNPAQKTNRHNNTRPRAAQHYPAHSATICNILQNAIYK
ncbi:hypothetical protein A2U01_0111189, partial [Trifolium medium]|nr:hypothetical protein [Trifolium medium]